MKWIVTNEEEESVRSESNFMKMLLTKVIFKRSNTLLMYSFSLFCDVTIFTEKSKKNFLVILVLLTLSLMVIYRAAKSYQFSVFSVFRIEIPNQNYEASVLGFFEKLVEFSFFNKKSVSFHFFFCD